MQVIDSRKRREATEEIRHSGISPEQVEVLGEADNENEIQGSAADDLIGDA
jgi:hypothetical protein